MIMQNLEKNPAVKEHFKMVGPNDSQPIVRTFLGPGTYALTLTRPDTMIWIINHNVSAVQLCSVQDIRLMCMKPRPPDLPPRTGAIPLSTKRCSTKWTKASVPSHGRQSSKISWPARHPTLSSTSSCFGEILNQAGPLPVHA